MRNTFILILIMILLLVGCKPNTEVSPPVQSTNQDADSAPEPSDPAPLPTPKSTQEEQEVLAEEEIQEDIDACFTDPDHPIGKQIAADFTDQTTYTQVMDWFCSGFEFEDILTALQTAEVSDFHPEILLTMLEYGQTWNEIWAEIGLD